VSEPSDSTKEALGRSEGSKVQHSRSRSIPCSIRNTYYKEATRQSVGLGIFVGSCDNYWLRDERRSRDKIVLRLPLPHSGQCSPRAVRKAWPGPGAPSGPGRSGGARPNAQCSVDCGQIGITRWGSRAADGLYMLLRPADR
jgi:hypothetical protein